MDKMEKNMETHLADLAGFSRVWYFLDLRKLEGLFDTGGQFNDLHLDGDLSFLFLSQHRLR